MGPEAFIPTLMVYGAVPILPIRTPNSLHQKDRFAALAAARREIANITADLRVTQALKAKLPSATNYDLLGGDNVLVYQEQSSQYGRRAGKYVGPYRISKIRDKLVFVIRPDGEAQYHISHVIPDPTERGDKELKKLLEYLQELCSNIEDTIPDVAITETLGFRDPRQYSPAFEEAKRVELEGLIQRKAFTVVDKRDVPRDANILGSRFVLAVKEPGTPQEKCKARLVVQGHTDYEKDILVHASPNVRQSSVRVLVSVASIQKMRLWSQDVNQAYLQAEEPLQRTIFLRPPKEMKLPPEKLLLLKKPLYGLSDSGDYWRHTYDGHVKTDLGMTPTIGDPALYALHQLDSLRGLMALLVDDSIGAGDKDFCEESKVM